MIIKIKNFLLRFKIIHSLIKIKINIISKISILKMRYKKLLNKQKIPDILNNINIEISSKCNLGCKFCGYTKRNLTQHPYTIMSDDEFQNNISQCVSLGYKNIGLSPVTGDIFMDKNIDNKFKILEKENIEGYYFFTNFIPIKKELIDNLFELRKLKFIGISIYGNDLLSFKKIADSSESAYNRLISNLNHLYELLLLKTNKFTISIDQRTRKDFNIKNDNSDLSKILMKIISLNDHNIKYEFETNYNNWGGLIKSEDLKGLNMDLNNPNHTKVGACSLLFSRLIIGANNNVNACACRDADYSLKIGNTKLQNLTNILSYNNKKYLQIISDHEKGNYPKICKDCDFYTSIYSDKHAVGLEGEFKKKIDLNDFNKILQDRVR